MNEEYSDFNTVVYFAMSEEQAERENVGGTIGKPLPNSRELYFLLNSIPDELCLEKNIGWQKEISFRKEDTVKVLEYLYPDGTDIDYRSILEKIEGDTVYLLGFGD